jgi:hypothetical protein
MQILVAFNRRMLATKTGKQAVLLLSTYCVADIMLGTSHTSCQFISTAALKDRHCWAQCANGAGVLRSSVYASKLSSSSYEFKFQSSNDETTCNCFKWNGRVCGRQGEDGRGNLTKVHYKATQNCHNEFPLYNKYILIKIGKKQISKPKIHPLYRLARNSQGTYD